MVPIRESGFALEEKDTGLKAGRFLFMLLLLLLATLRVPDGTAFFILIGVVFYVLSDVLATCERSTDNLKLRVFTVLDVRLLLTIS